MTSSNHRIEEKIFMNGFTSKATGGLMVLVGIMGSLALIIVFCGSLSEYPFTFLHG
jgi:hypothetical protein